MPRTKRSTNDPAADCAVGMAEHRWRLTDRLIANRHMQGVHLPMPDKTHDSPKRAPHGFRGPDQRAESRVCPSIDPVVCKPHHSRHALVARGMTVGIGEGGAYSRHLQLMCRRLRGRRNALPQTITLLLRQQAHGGIRATAVQLGDLIPRTKGVQCFDGVQFKVQRHPRTPPLRRSTGNDRLIILQKTARNPRCRDGQELPGVRMPPSPFLPILDLATLAVFRIALRNARSAFRKHSHNPVFAIGHDLADAPSGGHTQRLRVERFKIRRLHVCTLFMSAH
jgi:hypothetical protein